MRLFVPLTQEEFSRLHKLAESERRRPQDQAAVLLMRALRATTPGVPTPPAPPGERNGQLDHRAEVAA